MNERPSTHHPTGHLTIFLHKRAVLKKLGLGGDAKLQDGTCSN